MFVPGCIFGTFFVGTVDAGTYVPLSPSARAPNLPEATTYQPRKRAGALPWADLQQVPDFPAGFRQLIEVARECMV